MLASYISAVLCSLIASFIDVLSLTVQCRPCLFGKALHLGAYPGTHLHIRTETATSSTMSRLEAVTTELSVMRPELERLQAENARLQEDWPERAAEIDQAVEAERLKELYAQSLQDIQAKEEQIVAARSDLEATQEQLTLREATVQKWQAKCELLEKTCDTIRAEADQIRKECELEHLRALELERSKWEAREAQLEAQLRAAEENRRLSHSMERTPVEVTLMRSPGAKVPIRMPLAEVSTTSRPLEPEVTSPARSQEPLQGSSSSAESTVNSGEHVTALSQALLAQQIPPLSVFSGEGEGVEGSFSKWHEQLELVASMCQWSDKLKLINVATRLRGAAYAFFDHVLPTNEPATLSWWHYCPGDSPLYISSRRRAAYSTTGNRVRERQ